MKSILFLVLACNIWAAVPDPGSKKLLPWGAKEDNNDRINSNPLPKPTYINYAYDGKRGVSHLRLIVNSDHSLVKQAFSRFKQSLSKKWTGSQYSKVPDSSHSPLTGVDINITTAGQELKFNVSEAYTLKVAGDSNKVKITADTVWGALHALTTLQQLVLSENGRNYIESSVDISDKPSVPHRGLLVDSNRNFVGIESIKKHLDLMALSKLNVLHWHITDTASWPLEIKKYPEMTNDAFDRNKIFTQADIKQLVRYASNRGIRIIPELEIPGHARAGYLQIDESLIVCKDDDWTTGIANEPPPGQLDILSNETYEVLANINKELRSLFPDSHIHLGHDELRQKCFETQEKYRDYIEENSFESLIDYWVNRSLPIFSGQNIIMWEDFVTSYNASFPRNVTLQSWLGSESTKTITALGYKTIVSNYDKFYLDCGVGGFQAKSPASKSWCDYNSWQRIINSSLTDGLSAEQAKFIIGGEAALWAENIDDSNFLQMMWPRAAAFAENTWSDLHDVNDFYQRLFTFREYTYYLGYGSQPIGPAICFKQPHLCPLA